MIDWNTTKEDMLKIQAITKRATTLFEGLFNGRQTFLDIDMDLTACHLNDQPLDLDRLLTFENTDFAHDILGINRHIDRETGKLQDCFVPRCVAR